MTAFEELPEGCIAAVLSSTTPVDACRLSFISKNFLSASDSDAVWNRFLPSDISSIISQFPSLSNIPTKKDLYIALSDRPIIIDNGKKSFQLERKSGKKCYMLSARSLAITWGDTDQYWNWTVMPESRFPEVAELLHVCWLEIRGKLNTLALSPNTRYVTYLVFKMINAYGFEYFPVELSVGIEGGHSSTKIVCLADPNARRRHRSRIIVTEPNRVLRLQRPNVRSDGWLEIEMGEFFISRLEDEEVQMSVIDIKGGHWKRGFFVEGIEVRPKEDH
uniref:F-box domain-containing protein n=1 Tax=Medicago truncatula TaxID=3880 RepID=I3S297_MEDTR|nr:unknown [Medicago truncatula]